MGFTKGCLAALRGNWVGRREAFHLVNLFLAYVVRKCQARKRDPNLNLLVRIFSGGVGVLHVKGWGPKSSVCPLKTGKPNFFCGISRDFPGISRRCQKSLRKKHRVQFLFPKVTSPSFRAIAACLRCSQHLYRKHCLR